VSPVPATPMAPPAPCVRWAAQKDMTAPMQFVAQEALLWDPRQGEWVRLLVVWDRRQPGTDHSQGDFDSTPTAGETPWNWEADPTNDLMEPGVNPEELPRWEQLFDRWEKALADRQREPEHPGPAAAAATL
jgi:hypothetical protein